MPRSPQWMDLYQIWFRVSSRWRNQLCGILLQSADGFRFCEGSKFAISHSLGQSPLTQCWRYRAAGDNGLPARWSTPFWQPAYRLNFMCTFIFLMANKLSCCCCQSELKPAVHLSSSTYSWSPSSTATLQCCAMLSISTSVERVPFYNVETSHFTQL